MNKQELEKKLPVIPEMFFVMTVAGLDGEAIDRLEKLASGEDPRIFTEINNRGKRGVSMRFRDGISSLKNKACVEILNVKRNNTYNTYTAEIKVKTAIQCFTYGLEYTVRVGPPAKRLKVSMNVFKALAEALGIFPEEETVETYKEKLDLNKFI